MIEAIVVGAGQGKRMKSQVPKVFLPLGPYPVFMHSVLTLARVPEIADLVLVVPAGEEELFKTLCQQHGCEERIRAIIAGGERRQDSVTAGFTQLSAMTSVVLIHDAARPFVSEEIIRRVIQATRKTGVALPGVPVADTLKVMGEDNQVVKTIARDALRAAQTPQGFQKSILEKALAMAKKTECTVTDEATLAEQLGFPVAVVEGEAKNFKLTTPWDYQIAQWLQRSEVSL
jgi:2-C-methyl-D-erythritol 4-phosphate cytidylyltransferase